MKEVTWYYCDFCTERFKSKQECIDHEAECADKYPKIAKEYAQKLSNLIFEAGNEGVKIQKGISKVVFDITSGELRFL